MMLRYYWQLRGVLLVSLCVCSLTLAKEKDKKKDPYGPYKFKTKIEIPHTPVKSQDSTGTCWAFATISFLESEHLRIHGDTLDLSEVFVARQVYPKKAENYIRMHGRSNFWEGSLSHDAIGAIQRFGILPESAYPGQRNKKGEHDHREMAAVLKAMLDAVLKKPAGKLSTRWAPAFESVLDVYLGEVPDVFDYAGTQMTARQFCDEVLNLDLSEYVQLTSFTHHPYYETFRLEVPDNWSAFDQYYNVPLDVLEGIVDQALALGYSVTWDGDVSEKSDANKKRGYSIIPEDAKIKLKEIEKPVPEKEVDQTLRQETFDNFETKDDHLMHLIGVAHDQTGKKFFIVKDSWYSDTDYHGKIYLSQAYFQLKTIAVMLHRDALLQNVRNQLGL